ncbi:hypothetical protein EVAR_93203_1 [Eumeta japonica]|uniref:Uncharacterized protein n=1 Tax=Eumeta variegata TaxID=151549 RepID=A0A4C1TXK7_EUMVA|nr:hypothetical protein EVAR_93203_1 [Eumeta japonica]
MLIRREWGCGEAWHKEEITLQELEQMLADANKQRRVGVLRLTLPVGGRGAGGHLPRRDVSDKCSSQVFRRASIVRRGAVTSYSIRFFASLRLFRFMSLGYF